MRTESLVVRYVARRAVPFIQIYALYVLGHGEDGPGGGFQAGVIFAASFVLLALAEGQPFGRACLPEPSGDALASSGVLLYAGIGLLCLLLGGAFLEYDALTFGAAHPRARNWAHHVGIVGIEVGVMLTVTGAMATLFFEIGRPSGSPPPAAGSGRGGS